MNLRRAPRLLFAEGMILATLFWSSLAPAQIKHIRLRNEEIATLPAPAIGPRPQGSETPVSGLYLVQFSGPVRSEWRTELRDAGVTLIRSVPEDAFVARLDRVSLDSLRARNFVHWVGEYRAEHKLHSALRDAIGPRSAGAGEIAVRVQCVPGATPSELATLSPGLANARQISSSRFGTVWQGQTTAAGLAALARSPFVLWIEPTPENRLLDEIATKIVAGDGGPHVSSLQRVGWNGSNIIVAVADSGLSAGDRAAMHPDILGRVPALFQYGGLPDASDQVGHGTLVAGVIAGNGATGETDSDGNLYGLGVAPGAQIIGQRIFDADGRPVPYIYETVAQDAVKSGALIGANSWGHDPSQSDYDLDAAMVDAIVRDADPTQAGDQGYLLTFAAGNSGPQKRSISSPASAKNVITVGATQNGRTNFLNFNDGPDIVALFSSRGPTDDGRIKPDLVAPGTWIASLRSSAAGNSDRAPISSYYSYDDGTSLANPHVAGAAAVFMQYYRDRLGQGSASPALVKASLINMAASLSDPNLTGPAPVPNFDEGWGRVDLSPLVSVTRRFEFLNQTNLLTNDQVFDHTFVVQGTNETLILTLAYTDVPGLPSVIPALVNDLDLEVIAPDGQVYRGNQFQGEDSAANPAGYDRANNVEGVRLSHPRIGEYHIHVIAHSVVEDACQETDQVDQDFALVISGDILSPGAGIVLLDQQAYSAPGVIQIRVIDTDLELQPSVMVQAKSDTEPAGEPITLLPSSFPGEYTGSVSIATGPPGADGLLQVRHGDTVRILYSDIPTSEMREAIATIDLNPPQLTNISIGTQLGQMVVGWTTDEAATATVLYGPGNSPDALMFRIQSPALTLEHSVGLTNLIPGSTNYFVVISCDAAGNSTTNDNGGNFFRFIALSGAPVLLVNAYLPDTNQPIIPLSAYTNALNQTGVRYDVWDVDAKGSPTVPDLSAYQIVVWRINDAYSRSNNSLSAAQRESLTQYVDAGGSFFLASMEILTRINDVPFRSNILQVSTFIRKLDRFSPPCTDCDEDEDVGIEAINGVARNSISSGMNLALDYSGYPAIPELGLGPDFSDTFGPTEFATPIFTDTKSGKVCGICYPKAGFDTPGRVVFLSFPLDAVPETNSPPNNRATLLRNAFQFLAPGFTGLGTVQLNQSKYRLPDLVTVEVADTDLIGTGLLTVNFHSDSDTNPVPIVLLETVRRGLFRGTIALVRLTNSFAAGRLRVRHNDRIYADYFDASAQLAVVATAVVDAVPPVISDVTVSPGFSGATLTWRTSEAADSTAFYGESALLDRSQYQPQLVLLHTLKLTGLAVNQKYLYRISSQDEAGNATTADNGGQLFTFQTLNPLSVPYCDDLENGAPGWTVSRDDDSATEWEADVPNNSVATEAHSGFVAWCSSRNGIAASAIDTSLTVPAIDLRGGNVASLSFWHTYDFSERTNGDVEMGRLFIITNEVSAPVLLKVYFDRSPGWIMEDVDVSLYLGQTVRFMWNHRLTASKLAPRPGWVIDDVCVTVATEDGGTILVTNNLAQGGYVVSGRIVRTGSGLDSAITNAPPGVYVIAFNPVPYFTTPGRQTNALASGDSIVFAGSYTIVDTNNNGIADGWELNYFGEISTNRTQFTDTDGDGFSDYAEFMAGTDPNVPNSQLRLRDPTVLDPGLVRLQWPSVRGRTYRVSGSTNLTDWTMLSDWINAQTEFTTWTNSIPLADPIGAFRLEVRP